MMNEGLNTESAFHLVVATGVHAPVLAALHGACFDAGWDASSFDTTLAMPGCYAFVAVGNADDEPLGFVLVRVVVFGQQGGAQGGAQGGEAEILSIATRPRARGRGIARALLRRGLDFAAELGAARMFLEVGADNPAAIALYRAFGFCETGRRAAYYGRADGTRADALTMALTLSD